MLGTPGADNQVQVNAQLVDALVDFGCDPHTAVEYPRWSSNQDGQAGASGSANPSLVIETSFGSEVLTELSAGGHELQLVAPLGGPGSAEIIRISDNGLRIAGSDPRRDGWAAAF
ncbi:gamma-glutamyltransferase [Bradyrhizobium cenepequi]|uniref:gamma-glutamyltransferase n=1 Tax=Bradyrhizobium cenepequi TaxID=2821403 RepID=UPI0035E1F964|nr:gamma-glutamyltransferase [Bradyrhizobium cenepequi]